MANPIKDSRADCVGKIIEASRIWDAAANHDCRAAVDQRKGPDAALAMERAAISMAMVSAAQALKEAAIAAVDYHWPTEQIRAANALADEVERFLESTEPDSKNIRAALERYRKSQPV
jgi:hypothetical protein